MIRYGYCHDRIIQASVESFEFCRKSTKAAGNLPRRSPTFDRPTMPSTLPSPPHIGLPGSIAILPTGSIAILPAGSMAIVRPGSMAIVRPGSMAIRGPGSIH